MMVMSLPGDAIRELKDTARCTLDTILLRVEDSGVSADWWDSGTC
jgi:hypothetical protein